MVEEAKNLSAVNFATTRPPLFLQPGGQDGKYTHRPPATGERFEMVRGFMESPGIKIVCVPQRDIVSQQTGIILKTGRGSQLFKPAQILHAGHDIATEGLFRLTSFITYSIMTINVRQGFVRSEMAV